MIVSKVVGIGWIIESMITVSTITLPILSFDHEEQDRASGATDPKHSETHAISRGISWLFPVEEYVRCYNATWFRFVVR